MDASAGEVATPLLELGEFSGPLDLLLTLARAQQIDLARISLLDLINQLAAALQQAGIMLGEKGDWLVMGAWLVLLRSRLLLPAQQAAEDEAHHLRDRLLDLHAAQALAAWLDHRPRLGHGVLRRGSKQGGGISLDLAQPERPVFPFDDDGHPVLYCGKLPVRVRRDGREGPQSFAVGRPPLFPYTPEGDRIAVHAGHGEGNLAVEIIAPLVVCGGGYEAAAPCERRPEHPGRGHSLGAGIDRLARLLQILREVRHHSPLEGVKLALSARMQPDHGRVLRRRHVPRWLEIRQRVHSREQPGDELRG